MNSNRELWQRLVAVEGIDGAGTTTLTRNLGESLTRTGIPFITGCEPTEGHIGRIIRKALSGEKPVQPKTLAMLFAADRREHLYSPGGIRDIVDSEKIYITDRYFFSSLAYQSLDAEWDWVYRLNNEYPLPGYLIYLGLPVEEAQKRISTRGESEIFDKEELQHRVSASYLKSIKAFRNQGMNILELDSREEVGAVCEAALEFLHELI